MRAEDGFRGARPSGGLPLGCDRSACYSGGVLRYDTCTDGHGMKRSNGFPEASVALRHQYPQRPVLRGAGEEKW